MTKSANGRFQKGRSGNPGGRPKIVGEIQELARRHGPEAFERIVAIAHGKDDRLALVASVAILDRAYGKPGLADGELDLDIPIITRIERVIIPAPPRRDDPGDQLSAPRDRELQ